MVGKHVPGVIMWWPAEARGVLSRAKYTPLIGSNSPAHHTPSLLLPPVVSLMMLLLLGFDVLDGVAQVPKYGDGFALLVLELCRKVNKWLWEIQTHTCCTTLSNSNGVVLLYLFCVVNLGSRKHNRAMVVFFFSVDRTNKNRDVLQTRVSAFTFVYLFYFIFSEKSQKKVHTQVCTYSIYPRRWDTRELGEQVTLNEHYQLRRKKMRL